VPKLYVEIPTANANTIEKIKQKIRMGLDEINLKALSKPAL